MPDKQDCSKRRQKKNYQLVKYGRPGECSPEKDSLFTVLLRTTLMVFSQTKNVRSQTIQHNKQQHWEVLLKSFSECLHLGFFSSKKQARQPQGLIQEGNPQKYVRNWDMSSSQ